MAKQHAYACWGYYSETLTSLRFSGTQSSFTHDPVTLPVREIVDSAREPSHLSFTGKQ